MALTPPAGMRDWWPKSFALRREVEDLLRNVVLSFGFEELSTPAMERREVLSGKYGEEGERLSFWVLKRGADLQRAWEKACQNPEDLLHLADYGLRYDLTVPLARLVAGSYRQLTFPFKRLQLGTVWRAERPQHGRFREFTQCDADIVGSAHPLADAEILALFLEGFRALGERFRVKGLNITIKLNHRGILAGLLSFFGEPAHRFTDFCQALDKWDKVGEEGVLGELKERGFPAEMVERFQRWWSQAQGWRKAGMPLESLDLLQRGMESWGNMEPLSGGIRNLQEVLLCLERYFGQGLSLVEVDLTLARGLDYYTGMVFEAVSSEHGLGSLGGGGRYDQLIGFFTGEEVPAVGGSFGVERIVEIVNAEKEGSIQEPCRVVLMEMDPSLPSGELMGSLHRKLRMAGFRCLIDYDLEGKLSKRIPRVSRLGAHFAVFIGGEEKRAFENLTMEVGDSEVALDQLLLPVKRLRDGEQRRLSFPLMVEWFRSHQELMA